MFSVINNAKIMKLKSFFKLIVTAYFFLNSATIFSQSTPSAPTGLSAEAYIESVNLNFTAPGNNGGSAITNYEYSLNNGNWTPFSPARTSGPLTISGLTTCTQYTIKIRAVNINGGGVASSQVVATPRGAQPVGWTSYSSAASNNYWYDVTFGNGLFVAVSRNGTGNRVMTSPNGTTWTSRTSAADKQWRSVTFGNNRFVAVSGDGAVMTSDDGITWTSRTSAANNDWRSVTFGNNLFVAVSRDGTGNRVMTSPDGITWTSRTSAADNQWLSVTFGNGLFVAFSSNGANRVMTSPNGTTWSLGTSIPNNVWQGVTFGNNRFVAVSGDGAVLTSTDGISWSLGISAAVNNWSDITYGNGSFVAVSSTGNDNRVMTSQDGVNWSIRTTPASIGYLYAVTFGNGLFVAVSETVSSGINQVLTSSYALAPGAPSITSLTRTSSTQATIGFTAPSDIGSSAITNYEYSINDGSSWVTRSPASTSNPLTITGLSGGQSYQVRIRAINTAGSGCASSGLNSILPVTWLSFTGKKVAQDVELNWSTSSEQNTQDFQVQHSINAQQWTAVGTLPAAGNSNTVRNYQYLHQGPFKISTQHYYRILQRDLDGKFSYSKVIRIEYPEAASDLVLYPNSTSDVLRVNLTERQELRLVNMQGVVVWKGVLPAGRHEIPVSHFAAGNYILQAGKGTYKVMIQ
ncbi:MAG: T9SS type A sorting domain-containing protein [Sphingomonadales bacterium]|nr:T9SS type A sorting domain-containing protein [Sphingomonadales bacterium]